MHPLRKKRLLFISLMALCVILAVTLILWSLGQKLNHFYLPTEFFAAEVVPGTKVVVGGLVAKNSVRYAAEELSVEFKITDYAESIAVEYQGVLPDLFREGQGVIVKGYWSQKSVLIAQEVLAKHDENYMPPAVKEGITEGAQKQKALYQ